MVGLLDVLIGTLEERNVLFQPIGGLVIGDRGDRAVGWQPFGGIVRTLAVEGRHIAAQRVGFQDRTRPLGGQQTHGAQPQGRESDQ
jgi:hypothetical protein